VSAVCYNPDGNVSGGDCKVNVMPEPTIDIPTHLVENLHYPEEARDNEKQGTVTVQFVVSKNGEIKDLKSVGRRVGWGLEEEAIRVMRIMPKWKPGKMHNRPADVYYTQRITFRLE